MPYKPILDVAELPPPGQRFPEHLHFDIKAQVPPPILKGATGPEDLACDVAAFANANGGVILVGAHEEPRGSLKAYVPMTDKEVAAVVALYERARDLCSPRPIINPRALDRNMGEWVLAINVDAYGLLAIPPSRGETYPTPTLLFNKGIHYAAALLKVDADHGVAYFKAHPQWPEQEVCIPIDSMVTFWLDPSDGLHRIRIDGRLNDDRGRYTSGQSSTCSPALSVSGERYYGRGPTICLTPPRVDLSSNWADRATEGGSREADCHSREYRRASTTCSRTARVGYAAGASSTQRRMQAIAEFTVHLYPCDARGMGIYASFCNAMTAGQQRSVPIYNRVETVSKRAARLHAAGVRAALSGRIHHGTGITLPTPAYT